MRRNHATSGLLYMLPKLFCNKLVACKIPSRAQFLHSSSISHLHHGCVLGLDVRGLVEGLPCRDCVAEGEAALGDADVALDEGRVQRDGGASVLQGLLVLREHHVARGAVPVVRRTFRVQA